ncbi:hypothetical protein [Rhodococcus opacus]|uniref:hypothetical protein n=1 Tax=Rhodococcus opacus TaxID=37919 RepID=UPI002953E3C9|nr:hypothetical protein [Rhodococcus opacus]MDV7088669.1 hypothetical protein [Rhodococcus opacus]
MSESWTPEEKAVQDQIEAAYRAVEKLGSPALRDNEQAKVKVDKVLDQNRRYLASWPDDGYEGGSTIDRAPEALRILSSYISGGLELPGATIYEVTTDDPLPMEPYDPNNPDHQRAPFIVFANEPEKRYVVRPPLSVARLVVGICAQRITECDWHHGPPRPATTGVQQISLLSIARGQYLVVFAVCGKCRQKLQRATKFYGHNHDAALRDAEGVEGFPSEEWVPYDPDNEGHPFHPCVLWGGLRWTMPTEVMLEAMVGLHEIDPRAWDVRS